MNQVLALLGFAILCYMAFVLQDTNAKGILIGSASSAIGFYTGSVAPDTPRRPVK
jgi:hypothetical protein